MCELFINKKTGVVTIGGTVIVDSEKCISIMDQAGMVDDAILMLGVPELEIWEITFEVAAELIKESIS